MSFSVVEPHSFSTLILNFDELPLTTERTSLNYRDAKTVATLNKIIDYLFGKISDKSDKSAEIQHYFNLLNTLLPVFKAFNLIPEIQAKIDECLPKLQEFYLVVPQNTEGLGNNCSEILFINSEYFSNNKNFLHHLPVNQINNIFFYSHSFPIREIIYFEQESYFHFLYPESLFKERKPLQATFNLSLLEVFIEELTKVKMINLKELAPTLFESKIEQAVKSIVFSPKTDNEDELMTITEWLNLQPQLDAQIVNILNELCEFPPEPDSKRIELNSESANIIEIVDNDSEEENLQNPKLKTAIFNAICSSYLKYPDEWAQIENSSWQYTLQKLIQSQNLDLELIKKIIFDPPALLKSVEDEEKWTFLEYLAEGYANEITLLMKKPQEYLFI
jgi:hypothetical protein